MKRSMMALALAACYTRPTLTVEGTEGATGGSTPQTPSTPAPQPSTPSTPSTPAPNKPAKARKPAKGKKAAPAKKKSGASGKSKGVKGMGVLKVYAPQYKKGGKSGEEKTSGGNKTIDNGDKLADELRGKTLDEVYAKAAKVCEDADGAKMSVPALKKLYGKLNIGQQRMNLGNRMRAALGISRTKK